MVGMQQGEKQGTLRYLAGFGGCRPSAAAAAVASPLPCRSPGASQLLGGVVLHAQRTIMHSDILQ